jgi:hypothetical protein
VGQVGKVATGISNATIYRSGNSYLVVKDKIIMSYVPNVRPDVGVVKEYFNLGGK